jgi:hypothetical protein
VVSVLTCPFIRRRATAANVNRIRRSVYWIIAVLVVGAVCLPKNPWSTIKSTLVLDLLSAIPLPLSRQPFSANHKLNPSSSYGYNPEKDPYYVTNLDDPLDPFIASALEDATFTNIVHIVLESMRSDSFPWQEGGILDQQIRDSMEKPGYPVNTQTITPFIDSIASHTLTWNTMWSTIPYSLKAMLGRIPIFSVSHIRLLRDPPDHE